MEQNGFNADFIEELKSKNDIVSVISKYCSLQKKGKTNWACCPFHIEKTPSFAVNEYEQYYHCFGCGVSGDVIKFIQSIESVDFYDACKILAENVNMSMPSVIKDETTAKLKKDKDTALKVLTDTARYYFNNLKLPESNVAWDYMKKRQLDTETIKAFGIGYSLGWNELVIYLKSLGYSEADLILSGVAERKNNNLFDCLGKRLIFPIINSYGLVVGFSARILEKSDFAKYKNTAQTIVFDKSKCVYNVHHLKELKNTKALNEVIIVEGQMDVISLYRSGIKNAVACMGTALTQFHAKEIKRFSDKVVVCFDGDGAGKKATLRSLDILVNSGLDVYVTSLPEGIDPDEFVLKYGKAEFENLIQKARYWVEYLIYEFSDKYDLNRIEQKRLFVNDCLNVINKLSSDTEKEMYLDIVKNISNISMSILKSDLQNIDKDIDDFQVAKSDNDDKNILKENAYIKAVKFVISALLHKKDYAYLDDNILNNLLNNDYIKVYNFIKENNISGNTPKIASLFGMFDDVDNNSDITDVINYNFNPLEDTKTYYTDCVKTLVLYGLKDKQNKLNSLISNTADITEKTKLLKELQEIIKNIKGLNDYDRR